MANPNRAVAAYRNRRWDKVEQLYANTRADAVEKMAQAKIDFPGATCRIVRYKTGPRSSPSYSFYVGVYRPVAKS